MHKLSLTKPINQPFSAIQSDETHWRAIAEAAAALPTQTEVPMVIGGERVLSPEKLENINPSTGESLGKIQQASQDHAHKAIQAALAAKPHWAGLAPEHRLARFRDLEAILLQWRYQTCATTMVECGFTANEMDASWAEMIDFVRFSAFYYTQLLEEQLTDGPMETNSMLLRPLKGFTCAVTPFNFPVGIGYHLPLVMALTGNTVVWKPSDDATLTSYLLMLALEEAGFPAGVVNMITGDGRPCLPPVLQHPEMTCLNFTGSFATARALGNYLFSTAYERQNFPRFVAETGGKDFLVADRAIDIEDTAACIVAGAFGRSGQKCSANSVVFVHEDVWGALKPALVRRTEQLKMTNPLQREADLGPVINRKAYEKITQAIAEGRRAQDVELLCGGEYSDENGFYIRPTVFEVRSRDSHLLTQEIFGPVTAVKTYRDLGEVTSIMDQHNYRLTGSVISRDESFLQKAIPLLSQYAGNFYVNRKTTGAVVSQQPFGGDGASGTNCKAGGKNYLLNFISQGTITRRHTRVSTPDVFSLLSKKV